MLSKKIVRFLKSGFLVISIGFSTSLDAGVQFFAEVVIGCSYSFVNRRGYSR